MSQGARSGLLAGGNWIVDKLKRIDTYPAQDALANILDEAVGNGGGPFNVLVDLARLGAPFPLAGVGLVGDDSEGRWILDRCREHGIDPRGMKTTRDAPTSYTDVMTVAASGRRTFFHQRGANAFLDVEHFDLTAFPGKLFYLGYLLLLDRLDGPDEAFGTRAARLLRAASEAGFLTCTDLVSESSDRFGRVVKPSLPEVDFAILNELELEKTSGVPTRTAEGRIDLAGIERASRQLIEAGVRRQVIVHFPEGATALDPHGAFHHQPSVRVETIRSSVGAGDAFAAGLLHALHEEEPITTALKAGVCVAAASLAGAGASDGIGPLQDCLNAGENAGFRESEP